MRICIFGSNRWFSGSEKGGAEKQVFNIANSMALRGHRVFLIVPGEVRGFHQSDNRIQVISAWRNSRGIPGLRSMIGYRKHSLFQAISKLDADLYYTRGTSVYHPVFVNSVKRIGKVSVIALASDLNLKVRNFLLANNDRSLKWKLTNVIALLYAWRCGIAHADHIGTQNHYQYRYIMSKYGNAVMIPNIFEPRKATAEMLSDFDQCDAIWIGRDSYVKGVDILRRLVSLSSHLSFRIIGLDPKKHMNTLSKNAQIIDHMRSCDIPAAISSSAVLINTSYIEGFPNTFLEAWYEGVPVVSYIVNPNNLLSNDLKLGSTAGGSLSKMLESLEYYRNNPNERNSIGNKAKSYVVSEHSPEHVCQIIESLINQRQ